MSNLTMTMDRLLHIPYQKDKEKNIWEFYCPHCREWHEDRRHGYSSRFCSQMYFTCPSCGLDIEAPGWWVK